MEKHVLTIFAHPDDAETSAGGTLLTWAAAGARITLCIITDGDKGTADPTDRREQVIARRRQEQERAATRLGAQVLWLGYEDGLLQPTLQLRRDLVRVIRTVRPNLVMTHDPTVWFRHGVYINHPDHRAAGQAVLEAIYPAVKKPLAFPELLEEGLQPHVVEEVWLALTDHPDTFVDITGVLEEKLALIGAHASQFPPEPTRLAFTHFARETGERAGMEAAEGFRVLRQAQQTVQAFADRLR
jgi:LmbE family N-acetylglucosaminyl deacetylase